VFVAEGRLEEMPEDNIDQTRTLIADFASPTPTVVFELNPVVLDLEKLLVEPELLSRIQLPLRKELVFRVSQNFFAMAQDVG